MSLIDYVLAHTARGACTCGRCVKSINVGPDGQIADVTLTDPAVARMQQPAPGPHTVDLVFFKVSAVGDPSPVRLRELLSAHEGHHNTMNPLDGAEHSYLEIGGWVGDQGVAMQLMGLGAILGLWDLLTPYTVLKLDPNKEEHRNTAMQYAGTGLVCMMAKPTPQ